MMSDNPLTSFGHPGQVERHADAWSTILVLFGVILVTVAAFSAAWVTEDAFITFRYIDNLWAGHGLVFNIGERVQGFTHPLWLFLLAALPAWATYHYSMALGIVCTAGAAFLVGLAWRNRFRRATGFVVACAVLASSNAFRSFSTSGLENALTHFLLACLFYAALGTRTQHSNVWGVCGSGVLILLNRLDQFFLVAPISLLTLLDPSSGTPRATRLRAFALAATPLLGWWFFAALYFGFPLPNTFYAKLTPTDPAIACRQGLIYAADYGLHEPVHACVLLASLILPWLNLDQSPSARRATRALSVGLASQLAYVLACGGDYMRGRFLVSSLFIATVLLAFLVDTHLRRRAHHFGLAVVGLAFAVFGLLSENVQVPYDEAARRQVYDERRLRHVLWLANQTPNPDISPPRPEMANTLRRYAIAHGAIVVRWDSVGEVPYWAGSQVSFIDGLGLIDPFVARCRPVDLYRIGHISRDIPEAYFRARESIHLLPDWENRLAMMDPTLRFQAEAATGKAVWRDQVAEQTYYELQVLTKDVIFSIARLKLILKYTFSLPKAYSPARRAVTTGDIRIRTSFEPRFGDVANILQVKPDGYTWNDPDRTVDLRRGQHITIDFGRQVDITGFDLQADWDDFYQVSFSRDGVQFGKPVLLREATEPGMRTRATGPAFSRTARFVRIQGLEGDGVFSVGYLRLRT